MKYVVIPRAEIVLITGVDSLNVRDPHRDLHSNKTATRRPHPQNYCTRLQWPQPANERKATSKNRNCRWQLTAVTIIIISCLEIVLAVQASPLLRSRRRRSRLWNCSLPLNTRVKGTSGSIKRRLRIIMGTVVGDPRSHKPALTVRISTCNSNRSTLSKGSMSWAAHPHLTQPLQLRKQQLRTTTI